MSVELQPLLDQMTALSNHARQQVEAWTNGDAEPALLADASTALGQISGSARMAQVDGVALFADEVRALLGTVASSQEDSAVDALADGMMRLTDYIEQLAEGADDRPQRLRPALNELRTARGEAPLDEVAMFGKLLSMRAVARLPFTRRTDGSDTKALAARMLPVLQKALAVLMRDKQVPQALQLYARVAQDMGKHAMTPAAFRLWWVAGGYIEALREDGSLLDDQAKRLLGRLERRLRLIAEKGEQVLSTADADPVVTGMLFQVARASATGEQVEALRKSFKLAELRGDEAPESDVRKPMIGRLLRTVGAALQDDLTRLRDNLDIYVRTGLQQRELIEPMPAVVRKLSETLQAVGSSDMVELLEEVRELLENLVGAAKPDRAVVDTIADRVLRVDDALRAQLPRASGGRGLEDALRGTDFANARRHLVGTGLEALSRVKQSILEFSEIHDAELLEQAPGQLQEFAGTLRVAALDNIADQMDRVASRITGLRRGEKLEAAALDTIAEALVCLELFLEAIRDGQRVREGLVERASELLDRLDLQPEAVAAPGPAPGAGPEAAPSSPAIEGEPDPEMLEVFLEEAREQCDAAGENLAALRTDISDAGALAELRRAFHTLKGSGRMVGATRVGEFAWAFEQMLNRCIERPGDMSAQVVELVAQGVATVPGLLEQIESGRDTTVDVERLAAHATALARGEAAPEAAGESPAALDDALRRARETLETWLDAAEQGRATGNAPAAVLDALSALVTAARTTGAAEIAGNASEMRGRLLGLVDPDAGQLSALRGSLVQLVADDAAGDARETEMTGVFAEEAHDLLAQLGDALEAWQQDSGDKQAMAEMQRCLHTLKGGARTSGLRALGGLAHELETLLLRAAGTQPGGEVTSVLQRGLDRLFDMLDDAVERRTPRPFDDLKASIAALVSDDPGREDESEEEAAAKAADRRNRPRIRYELARVRADVLDKALNSASEISIYRLRIEQQLRGFIGNIAELKETIERLHEQLRKLEIETETQIVFQHSQDDGSEPEFDPLELDRYSQMQQLSRALMESISDLMSLQGSLDQSANETENLLQQQSRAAGELQEGLMRTRMIPLHTNAERMRRVVRQAAEESGRMATLRFEGADVELDRQVLDRLLGPLEHMLRNAVIHGIEPPEQRVAAGKPDTGQITIALSSDASELVLTVRDDGAGLDLDAIRARAEAGGLLKPGERVDEAYLARMVLKSGFSTASSVTESAGRGVGLDVVNSEVSALGGVLDLRSTPGQGVEITLRMPFTMSVTQALLATCGQERYAIPLPVVEGIVRLPPAELEALLERDPPLLEYGGESWEPMSLGQLLGRNGITVPDDAERLPALLVRAGSRRAALFADSVSNTREVVVKSLGPHLGRIPGLSGATILGDGSVVLIIDAVRLVRGAEPGTRVDIEKAPSSAELDPDTIHVLVVDDSITVRRVTQRMLERRRMKVRTARDGIEAMAALQERIPDVVLLDIEMPRMDGFELAEWMRREQRFENVPIIMITSRSGEKHRNRAKAIGVDRYLGKPYQELDLLQTIQGLISKQVKMSETQYPAGESV